MSWCSSSRAQRHRAVWRSTRTIKARVTPHLGCVVLRSAVWIDNLAAALQSVPERDRAAYSAIKAIELLYLISTDSPLLTMPPESVSRDHYLTDTVRQVQEYMVSAPVRPAHDRPAVRTVPHFADRPEGYISADLRSADPPVSARKASAACCRTAASESALHRGYCGGGRL